ANQVRGPQVAGAPRHRAVQQHFAVRGVQRGGELVELLRAVRIRGGAAHRDVHVLHAELFRERGLVEADPRHFFRRGEVHDRGHASPAQTAGRFFGRLAADEYVVADAHELVLEQSLVVERDGVRYGTGFSLAENVLTERRRTERYGDGQRRERANEAWSVHPSSVAEDRARRLPIAHSGISDPRKVRGYQIGNLLHSEMCSGMNTARRMPPAISAVVRVRPRAAATPPAATVARAPMASRASFIGSVNVISPATRTYSGQAARMTRPAMNTTATH